MWWLKAEFSADITPVLQKSLEYSDMLLKKHFNQWRKPVCCLICFVETMIHLFSGLFDEQSSKEQQLLFFCKIINYYIVTLVHLCGIKALISPAAISPCASSHITLQPKTGCPLKLSRVGPGQYLDGRPPGKTRLLPEEVLVRPAGGAHPVVCVGPNAPV